MAMEAAKSVCSLMGACAFGLNFVPAPVRLKVQDAVRRAWDKFFRTADPFSYVEVPSSIASGATSILDAHSSSGSGSAVDDHSLYSSADATNPFYEDVSLYLRSLNIELQSKRVSVFGNPNLHRRHYFGQYVSEAANPPFVFGLPLNQTLMDTFQGANLWWTHTTDPSHSQIQGSSDRPHDHAVFVLTMLQSDKPRLLRAYLLHISKFAHDLRRKNTLLTLYTNSRHGSHWTPYSFKHPSTFDSIALEDGLAERIQDDLVAFSESEDFYHRIGRTWKRGYLLYGPPGTGKSSLIAAIANFMHYDLYDLELTNVHSNSDLKQLLKQTRRKSIIVIEDIDCAVGDDLLHESVAVDSPAGPDLAHHGDEEPQIHPEIYQKASLSHNQRNGLTLSGLLNFTDGLQSCFGEERIFIFTTNHKERLDAALLRPGRMDMHILLSYCSFSAFKKLAFNYLSIREHRLFDRLEEAMKSGVMITPATIAEILIANRKDPDKAMHQVLSAVFKVTKM